MRASAGPRRGRAASPRGASARPRTPPSPRAAGPPGPGTTLPTPGGRARAGPRCRRRAPRRAGRRGGRRRRAAAEDARQRLLERRLHGDLVAVRDDDAPELGERALLGGREVERLDVDQRLLDREREQRAPDHARAPLVPQRELLRDDRVLVDARVDLARPEDQLLLGEVEDDQAAVVRRVRAGRQPRDHVVAPARVEEREQDELLPPLGREPHDRVVRLHLAVAPLDRAPRDRPEILLVVEHLRVVHVVHGVLPRLDREEVLRIADVLAQVGGHRVERLEQAGKRPRPGPHERVARVGEVEHHGAAVGVDRRLDRVADVVADAGHGVRVRVAVGRRVAVQHPDEPPVLRHHDVRIAVVAEERRNLPHAARDGPVHHDAALRREVVREEQVLLAEARGERELLEPGVDRDAALAGVAGVDVLVARGVVQLLGAGAHDDVLVGELAEEDLGPRDLRERVGRHGRDVLGEEVGQSLGRHPVHGAHDDAVAVREGQALVDPARGLQVLVGKLPRREHQLAVLAVQRVAVVVDVHELVVGPDLLELTVRAQQRPVIPEPDVLDRGGVARERPRVEGLLGREPALLDPVEPVGLAGHPDVVLDERPLGDELVRRHAEALEQRRIDPQTTDPGEAEDQEAGDDEAQPRPADLEHARHGAERGEHGEGAEHRERAVDVRVRGAEHDPAGRVDQLEPVEPEADRAERERQRGEPQQVRARPRREARAARREHEAPLQHVDDEREQDRGRREREGPAVDQPPERQHEDEERQVAPEQRVRDPERPAVQVLEHGLPVRGGAEPRDQREQREHDRQEAADQRLDHHPPGQAELVLELPDHVGRRRPRREREVRPEKDQHADRHREEQRAPQREDPGEHLRVPDLAEPQPVGVEGHDLDGEPQDEEDEEQDDDGLRPAHPRHRAGLRSRVSRRPGTRAAGTSGRRSGRPSRRA